MTNKCKCGKRDGLASGGRIWRKNHDPKEGLSQKDWAETGERITVLRSVWLCSQSLLLESEVIV